MEHIEEAGIHSGDSACSLPVHSLSDETVDELERQTAAMAKALNVGGLMNVQYAIKDGTIYVLEVNPRASRTVPFVAKTIGPPIAKIAARIMAGETLDDAFAHYGAKPDPRKLDHIAVKEAVFPFARFPGVDTLLGPEMRSTGEVMGLDRDFALAFAKSQLGAGVDLPRSGTLFVSVRDEDKPGILPPCAARRPRLQGDRHRRHRSASSPRTAWRPRRSTRCWKAVRISRTRSATGRCSSSSTPPTARRRCRIRNRCAAPR